MRKRLLSALLGLGLAASLAGAAEARVDHSPVSSSYGDGERVGKSGSGRSMSRRSSRSYAHDGERKRYRRSASGKRYGTSRRSARGKVKGRAMTAQHSGRGGGGTSRGCLQASARGLLNEIEQKFGAVKVISTCRPGAVVAGSGRPSKHRYGLAVDFDAGNRKGQIVNWLRANHKKGGTMTYAGMSHIHIDIGPHFVSLNSGGRARRRG